MPNYVLSTSNQLNMILQALLERPLGDGRLVAEHSSAHLNRSWNRYEAYKWRPRLELESKSRGRTVGQVEFETSSIGQVETKTWVVELELKK